MKCEKCKKDFPENEIHEHHIIPKALGGKDEDGRIYLCEKHHNILHLLMLSIIWKYVPETSFPKSWQTKFNCKKEMKNFTLHWVENDA